MRNWPSQFALLWLAACGAGADAAPDRVDLAAIPAEQIVARVLQHCHGPLAGMDRIVVEVTAFDGAQCTVFARLPGALRVQDQDGSALVLVDGKASAVRGQRGMALSPAQQQRLQSLLLLVDAAALGPLYRTAHCERLGPRRFRLQTRDGASWDCELEDGALRLATLRSAAGEIAVLEHLVTTDTRIVRRAAVAGLGTCTLRFLANEFAFAPDLFELPANEAAPRPANDAAIAPQPIRIGGEARPTVPTVVDQPAHRLAVFTDPGDWPARAAVVAQHWQELQRQGQRSAGFTAFLREGSRDLLAIPFRGGAFEPPPGWDVRERPAGRALVVFPAAAGFAASAAAGSQAIEQALAEQGLQAAGPILAQPYLHLTDGLPPADKLAAPVVRVSVALR